MPEIKIKLAAGTNVGMIRSNNEDNYAVCRDLTTSDWTIPQVGHYTDLGEYGSLLLVADGMGGNNAGEVASSIVVDTVKHEFRPEILSSIISSEKNIMKFLCYVVKTADLNILDRGRDDGSTHGMGTTVVMAWVINEKVYICWCGDSRCYVFNPNIGLQRLTKDHSLVQELIDNQELEPEYASDHPYSNVITRCLGDLDTRANPDTKVYQLRNNDVLLLCSDGLTSLCNDDSIVAILKEQSEDITTCKDKLINAALLAGGDDNVTVVLGGIKVESKTDEMAKTIRTSYHGGERKLIKAALLFVALVVSISAYIYWEGGYEQAYKGMIATLNGITLKVKSLLQ